MVDLLDFAFIIIIYKFYTFFSDPELLEFEKKNVKNFHTLKIKIFLGSIGSEYGLSYSGREGKKFPTWAVNKYKQR